MVTPSKLKADPGSSVEFICLFHKAAKWDYSDFIYLPNNAITMSKNIKDQQSNRQFKLLVLKIRNILPDNFGKYTCHEKIVYNVKVKGNKSYIF